MGLVVWGAGPARQVQPAQLYSCLRAQRPLLLLVASQRLCGHTAQPCAQHACGMRRCLQYPCSMRAPLQAGSRAGWILLQQLSLRQVPALPPAPVLTSACPTAAAALTYCLLQIQMLGGKVQLVPHVGVPERPIVGDGQNFPARWQPRIPTASSLASEPVVFPH